MVCGDDLKGILGFDHYQPLSALSYQVTHHIGNDTLKGISQYAFSQLHHAHHTLSITVLHPVKSRPICIFKFWIKFDGQARYIRAWVSGSKWQCGAELEILGLLLQKLNIMMLNALPHGK
ncbi:hypothetical protein SUGI_0797970 [Cryptomeria japonica]|nr:hypothetical protein SUGI_0797970 [Cryptomeria japonica]